MARQTHERRFRCHPERSEGSGVRSNDIPWNRRKVLPFAQGKRFAQDDM
jgi:hypothetical protein